MKEKFVTLLSLILLMCLNQILAQVTTQKSLLTLEKIFNSVEFQQEYPRSIKWIENGTAYVTLEASTSLTGAYDLIRYVCKSKERTILIAGESLVSDGNQLIIQNYSLSSDGFKLLIFTNSSRLWRSNTKGDYWVFDINKNSLTQIGKSFQPSSLMFAKFSPDSKSISYIYNFNIYIENLENSKITQLTFDGNRKVINGTFDWVYEEEFGKRDGFSWSPDGKKIAFWQIDASEIKDFYLINNTDSIYSKPYPVQYPMAGQSPSITKIGVINLSDNNIEWINIPEKEKDYYLPLMQWINDDLILIEQLNRKQNHLILWTYKPSKQLLFNVYSEFEDTWIDIKFSDISSNTWGQNELFLVDKNQSCLIISETDNWRHVYKINLNSGEKTLITYGEYDVATICSVTTNDLYFIASPSNCTQRYLFKTDLKGKGILDRITPNTFQGINLYNISPDGNYAFHYYMSTKNPVSTNLIHLPDHKIIKNILSNQLYKENIETLTLPEVRFQKITTSEGVEIDAKLIYPTNFTPDKKYPVLFYVYGGPWQQTALDYPIELWDIMLAQKGYFIITLDNRGTSCLKGKMWRKCVYKNFGVLDTRDQALAATELLKLDYLDNNRVGVWGWSSGGTMTLNLMFQYPEIYKTGISVAALTDQFRYDNIYTERYMGLPQENIEEYVKSSPVTYAKNLQGNLLIIHGTGDDNCHYQHCELLINELIKNNKQFQMMSYPNRTHSISEGENTSLHLYTLMTNFLLKYLPPNQL